MISSVFTEVLTDIKKYFTKKTPVTMYIPIVAFLGAWLVAAIAVFGLETPRAFWQELSLDLRAILIAALVFTVLLLTYLTSQLRILVTQMYQGAWPQILNTWLVVKLTDWRRKRQLTKLEALNTCYLRLSDMYTDCEDLWTKAKKPTRDYKEAYVVPKHDLPIYHLIAEADLDEKKKEDSYSKVWGKGWITNADKLLGRYTVAHLAKGKGVTQSQVLAAPSADYMVGRSVVSIAVAPHTALGGKDNVKRGDRIQIELKPEVSSSDTAKETLVEALVLDVRSDKEVVASGTDGSISRDLVVLVVAVKDIEDFLKRLPTDEVRIVRCMEAYLGVAGPREEKKSRAMTAPDKKLLEEVKKDLGILKDDFSKHKKDIEQYLKELFDAPSETDPNETLSKLVERHIKMSRDLDWLLPRAGSDKPQIKSLQKKLGNLYFEYHLTSVEPWEKLHNFLGDLKEDHETQKRAITEFITALVSATWPNPSIMKVLGTLVKLVNSIKKLDDGLHLIKLTGKVDLNHATQAELVAIDGIGPMLAEDIVDQRPEAGFSSLDDVIEIVGEWRHRGISSYLGSTPLATINCATKEELVAIDGIGPELAEDIVEQRPRAGFSSLDDVIRIVGEWRYHGISSQVMVTHVDSPKSLEELKSGVRDLRVRFLRLCVPESPLAQALDQRKGTLNQEMNLRFPGNWKENVVATELGNVLAAVERYPQRTYGIDAGRVFPRLKDVLEKGKEPAKALTELGDIKDKLDMLLLMSALAYIYWLPASTFLAVYGTNTVAFLCAFVGAPLLAWVCYKAAIQTALEWGETLKSLYDLHRWTLLKEFAFADLPTTLTLEEEKTWWRWVNRLLEGVVEHPWQEDRDGQAKVVKYRLKKE